MDQNIVNQPHNGSDYSQTIQNGREFVNEDLAMLLKDVSDTASSCGKRLTGRNCLDPTDPSSTCLHPSKHVPDSCYASKQLFAMNQ